MLQFLVLENNRSKILFAFADVKFHLDFRLRTSLKKLQAFPNHTSSRDLRLSCLDW